MVRFFSYHGLTGPFIFSRLLAPFFFIFSRLSAPSLSLPEYHTLLR
jgi:hypothetical protein